MRHGFFDAGFGVEPNELPLDPVNAFEHLEFPAFQDECNESWANVVDYVGLVAERHYNPASVVGPIDTAAEHDHASSAAHPDVEDDPNSMRIGVAAIFEARAFFQAELDKNFALTDETRSVLESALEACVKFPSASPESIATNDLLAEIDLHDADMYPSEDAMCLLLAGKPLPRFY